jgi:hypothetical protein
MGTIKIVNRSTFKGLLEEKRKIDPHIFKMTLKQVFMDYFSELWEMLLLILLL